MEQDLESNLQGFYKIAQQQHASKLIKRQDTQAAIDLVHKMNEKNHDYMYMNIINVLLLRNEPNKELTPELVKALREKGGE